MSEPGLEAVPSLEAVRSPKSEPGLEAEPNLEAVPNLGALPGLEALPEAGLVRFEFRPHNCFACGTLNAHGLHLVLHVEHGRSWTVLALDRGFEGWEGIAHGGIISAILDEVMAWSLVGADNWGVTARLTVNFKRPVPIGEPLRAVGVVTRERRRLVDATAELRLVESGELLATAEGVYMAAGPDRKRELREKYGFRLVPASDEVR